MCVLILKSKYHTHVCISALYARVCVCVCACLCFVCVCVCVLCVCVCVCACMYVCVCVMKQTCTQGSMCVLHFLVHSINVLGPQMSLLCLP